MTERARIPMSLRRGRASTELRYELASPLDAEECNAVNNGLLRRDRTAEQWKWEFAPPHLPIPDLPYAVARDGSRIVGTQGAILVPMLSESGPFWTAKGEDTMVLPIYWDRNALVGMYAVLADCLRRNGVKLLWGFNGKPASFSKAGLHYFSEPLCADHFCVLNHHAMDIVLSATSKIKRRFEGGSGALIKSAISIMASAWRGSCGAVSRISSGIDGRHIEIAELAAVPGEEFYSLSHRFVQRHGGITLHRTPMFLKWRLLDNPFFASQIITAREDGELSGFISWSLVENGTAYITDYFVCSPRADHRRDRAIAEALISAVILCARKANAALLRAQSFNGHTVDVAFRQALRKTGFLTRRRTVGPCYLPLTDAAELLQLIADYDRWFITSVYNEGRQG